MHGEDPPAVDSSRQVAGFSCLPRSNSVNGAVRDYEFYGSPDGDFGAPHQEGTLGAAGMESMIIFKSRIPCRFIKLRALSEANGNPWTNAAELNVFE